MDTELIATKDIKPNPWQPRQSIDPAAIAELAESIRHEGLLQPPVGRRLDGHVELAFGHRRLAAWQSSNPGQPMPVQLLDLTDRQMAEYAATENAARLDLNPVERARAMQRYIADFELTQVEVGRLFGLGSQGAVSNALRLLALPDDVLQLVSTGQLPERHARAMLPLMLTTAAKSAGDIARKVVAQKNERDREDALGTGMRMAIHKAGGIFMNNVAWKLEWPARNLAAPADAPKGAPSEIPPCRGCRFMDTVDRVEMCLRPACYKAKRLLFAMDETERASKRLGIAVAGADEQVVVLWPKPGLRDYESGDWGERKRYQGLVVKKEARPFLRVMPAQDEHHGYERQDVTGSEMVILATVNKAALDRLQPMKRAGSQSLDAKRIVAEARAREDRAKECKRLIVAASVHFGRVMPSDPALLGLLAEKFAGSDLTHANDLMAFKHAKDKRAQLARLVLLSHIPHWVYSTEATPAKATKTLIDLAAKLKVKLPAGWNRAPEPKPAAKKPAAKR